MSELQPILISEHCLTTAYGLSDLYRQAHNMMRNIDGLQPQEAFDELLKFLFFKQANEDKGSKLILSVEANYLSKEHIQKLASEIRAIFADYVENFNSWFRELWKDANFHLSDTALVALYQLFSAIDFSKIPFDTRSTALKEFLSSEMRRGLGIYLTPDDVVKMGSP